MNKLDPITAELIRNGLQAIVDEMALTLVRTAYSANLKSAMDLSSAMCDQHGRLIAQGLTLPLHLGSIPDAIEALLNRFAGSFRAGDAFVLNDPYEGGTHLPDFFVFQPVFLTDELFGYAVTIAHHTDVGGRVAGGNGCAFRRSGCGGTASWTKGSCAYWRPTYEFPSRCSATCARSSPPAISASA